MAEMIEPVHEEKAPLVDFLRFYHERAVGIDGVLRLTTVKPSMEKGRKDEVRSYPFAIGDVSAMALECAQRGQRVNVFFQPAVLRKDLPPGSRGKEQDIIAGLSVVVDDDRDKDGATVVLPPDIPPTFTLITSSDPNINRQHHYIFNRPVPRDELKEICELLYRKCGGDQCTGTITQPWRVPLTFNFPNRKKIDRGRPREPQAVELEDATFESVDPKNFTCILDSMPDLNARKGDPKRPTNGGINGARLHTPRGSIGLDDLTDWMRDLIVSEGDGDRSAHSFKTMIALMAHGVSDDEIRRLAEQYSFANKFCERGDIDEEIARVRER